MMDVPQPPEGKVASDKEVNGSGVTRFDFFCVFIFVLVDHELRTIIDKLAVFVARNGPDFEQMTKTKQKDNPKFEFLFGGRYFDYYLRKVSAEQSSEWCSKTRQPSITSCSQY